MRLFLVLVAVMAESARACPIRDGSLPPDHGLDLDLAVPDDAVALELTIRSDRESRTVRTKRDGWYAVAESLCVREFDAPVGTSSAST
jgi:hypothetical protein